MPAYLYRLQDVIQRISVVYEMAGSRPELRLVRSSEQVPEAPQTAPLLVGFRLKRRTDQRSGSGCLLLASFGWK